MKTPFKILIALAVISGGFAVYWVTMANTKVAVEIMGAIRAACPGVILNQSTGFRGPDYQPPLDCLRAVRPEIAACNAGPAPTMLR